jgi:diguanylate cyclase (GGDEF)-like protein
MDLTKIITTFNRQKKKMNVMSVSYWSDSMTSIYEALADLNYHIQTYSSCPAAIAALRAQPDFFDLIILDVNREAQKQFEMIRMVRMMEDLLEEIWRPVLLIGEGVDNDILVKGLRSGADDFILMPLDHRVIEAKITATQRLYALRKKQLQRYLSLQQESLQDELTGIANRRYFNKQLTAAMKVAQRHGRDLSVAYFDLDHFKSINDTYGHHVGDYVLKQVSKSISNTLRGDDTIGRLGGEEFCIIMPNTSLLEAKVPCERYRQTIESIRMEHGSITFNVTASFGVTQFEPYLHTQSTLLAHADHALYVSKEQGRNQITCLDYRYFEDMTCVKG